MRKMKKHEHGVVDKEEICFFDENKVSEDEKGFQLFQIKSLIMRTYKYVLK